LFIKSYGILDKRYFYIVLSLALFSSNINAQESNNWLFGDKTGLNFGTEPPTEISSTMYLPSGPCSVSDHKGNLLFYANADTIKNSKHNPMKGMLYKAPFIPNGDIQAAVIIPFVGDSNRYYHFITGNAVFYIAKPSAINMPRSVGYHIINMQGDSGLGEVEQQYTPLVPYNCDRITACRHSNGKDYWVITHTANKYLAIPVTEKGVGTPIITFMEEFHYGTYNYMAMSHDSRSLYSSVSTASYQCTEKKDMTALFKYDFDPATGIFSNQVIVDSCSFSSSDNWFAFYGIAFSPNDSIVYVSVSNVRSEYQVNQYRRFKNKDYVYEKYIINFPSWDIAFGIGLAPNGKLYSQGNSSTFKVLRILDRPDIFGAKIKNYKSTFSLTNPNTLTCGFEFPNFLFEYKRVQFDVTGMDCGGKIYIENKSDTQHFTSMTIYWGDEDSIVQNKGNSFTRNHNHIYTKPGIYFIRVMGLMEGGNKVWSSDSILVDPKLYNPIANFATIQQTGCLYQEYQFIDKCSSNDTVGGYTWYWDFGDGTNSVILQKNKGEGSINHLYTKSGYYTVKLIFFNGMCSDTFTYPQQIYIAPAPQAGFDINPKNGCVPQLINITPSHKDTIVSEKYYLYNNLNNITDSFIYKPNTPSYPKGYTLNQNDSGTFIIKQALKGTTGCITYDSNSIRLDTKVDLKLMNDTFICSNEILQISATLGDYKYLWNAGDTSQSIIINKGGTYSVKVTNGSCSVSDSTIITQDLNESCKFRVSLFPNPCNSQFTVSIYSRKEQNINIQLYEMSGKQVASYDNITANQFTKLEVNTEYFASDLYILQINTSERKYIYKIIKILE